MPELHIRNLPADLRERLRERAAAQGRSMSAEVVAILRGVLDHDDRARAIDALREIQAHNRLPEGAPSAEELVRQDRDQR